jgi:hypothetical protein
VVRIRGFASAPNRSRRRIEAPYGALRVDVSETVRPREFTEKGDPDTLIFGIVRRCLRDFLPDPDLALADPFRDRWPSAGSSLGCTPATAV